MFREINNDGYKATFKTLGYEHFMKCFKPAWDIAFTKDLNMAGWRVEGMIPFTRHALWRKVEECRLMGRSISLSTSPGSLAPSQPPSPHDPYPSPDNLQAATTLSPLPQPPQPLAPPPPPPLQIPPFPVAVPEAVDYMQSIAPAAFSILDVQAVLMQNVRLVEAAMVIGEWKHR